MNESAAIAGEDPGAGRGSAAPMPERGPSHSGLWLGFALAAFALHLAALTKYGWFRDEFYYVVCARNLAWGYVDHPPLSIAVLALVKAIGGESLVTLRLVTALVSGAVVFLVGKLARDLGGGRFAQALACLAALLTPVYLGITRFYSMNAIELLLWTVAALVVVAALRNGRPRDWVLLGVVVGLGLLNKISMMWFGFGLIGALVLTPHRRQLATPWPWLAMAIAGLLFAPHLLWQIQNGWPTLEFMRNATGQKMLAVPITDFVLGQFRAMGPINVLVYLVGLFYALFAPGGRAWRVFGLLFLAVAGILMAAGTSRPNYLAVAYPPLFALGGIAWERWTARGPRALRPALLVAVGVLNLWTVPLALPLLPVEAFVRYQSALGLAPSTEERHRMGPLPQGYADMFGWDELVDEVAKAAARLTPEERRRAVVFGQNYGEAGAVDVLGRRLGLPRAISGHNNYFLWGPGDWDGGVVIIIGGDRPDNAAFFDSLEIVGRTASPPWSMPYERDLDVSIGRGLKGDPKAVWPQLEHFD